MSGPPRGLAVMSEKNLPRFLDVKAVVADHGGEINFWSMWLAGELSPAVVAWFRDQAPHDPLVRRWLAVVESPQPRLARPTACAPVTNPPPADPPPWSDDDLTAMLTDNVLGQDDPDHRDRLRHCLFELLDEVEIRHPDDRDVQPEATALLDALVGPRTVRSFRSLASWLKKLRDGMSRPTRLDRVLARHTPELVEEANGRPRFRLSYRLFMRERFRRHAERRGWVPQGPRYFDRDSAFDALTRRRLGELARPAAVESEAAPWRAGWRLVCADCAG